MKNTIQIILATFLLIGVCGCSSLKKRHILDASEVAELAAKLANKEALQFYKVEPFLASDAKPVFFDGVWSWSAFKGFGRGDILASVSFKKDASEPEVSLRLLNSAESPMDKFRK
jgi:hypothetical protein